MKEKLNQFKAEFAKEIFKKADEGAISKEVALDLLTVYDLLPIAPWIELPTFMDSYDYFDRYSTIKYMNYLDIADFKDDPLRILRAIRFAVTKRFTIEQTTWQAMVLYDYDSKMPVVSEERIREELIKCFRCDTIRTLTYLDYIPRLRDYIFSRTNLWLKPTNEK